jgi:rod shape-determining protein MreB
MEIPGNRLIARSSIFVWNRNLAVDLGTTTTRIYSSQQDLMLSEPSVLARHRISHEVLAFGKEASQLFGKTPANLNISRPLRQGAICDFDDVCAMLKYFIGKTIGRAHMLRPRIVMAVSSQATAVERRAVSQAASCVGIDAVSMPTGIMAAIGAGLPVFAPLGSMIIDIGGGVTQIATVSLGGLISSSAVRKAGEAMDQAIMDYLKRKDQVLIGEGRAELIKTSLGLRAPGGEVQRMEIVGRDVCTGLPKNVRVTNIDVRCALSDWLREIITMTRSLLEHAPPEVAGDIGEHGIVLTGGGALLKNLDELLSSELGVPVITAQDPVTCVVRGLAAVLRMPSLLRKAQDCLILDPLAA